MGAEQCSHLGTRESHGDELRVASRASILRTRGGGFEKDTLLLVHAIGHPDSPSQVYATDHAWLEQTFPETIRELMPLLRYALA